VAKPHWKDLILTCNPWGDRLREYPLLSSSYNIGVVSGGGGGDKFLKVVNRRGSYCTVLGVQIYMHRTGIILVILTLLLCL